ncbi:substrate-binding domain-containing protein [Flavobacterium sp. N1994]|uniref:substrate-binding domain-containing protein n=1 Tax=Flavobacterium sp. N1994 TaxID=2986827 RepID=UPI002222F528|nr:substrate-binding domain-containing protein [Flavobacterium sp. N1994]
MITIKKIAELANVSPGTVDRIIHNRGQVTQENIDIVNALIEKHGYKRNIFASNLAFNKKFRIAVFLPKHNELEYWKLPIYGIEKAEKEYGNFGFFIDYYYYKYDSNSFKKNAEKLLKLDYDGLLFAPIFHNESLSFLNEYTKKNVPIIMIDSNIVENYNQYYIGQDAYQTGLLSAKLISYGIKKNSSILIAKIAKENDITSIFNQRVKGFYSYFENKNELNINFKEINIIKNGKVYLTKEMFNDIDAVYIPNSRSYIVAKFIKNNNLPNIRIIGYDLLQQNIEYLKLGYIDFLINQKPEEQGYIGITKLYKKLVLKEESNKNIYMPIEIITKENWIE